VSHFRDAVRAAQTEQRRVQNLGPSGRVGEGSGNLGDISATIQQEAFGGTQVNDLLANLTDLFGPELARLVEQQPGLEQAFLELLGGSVDLSSVTEGINQSVSGLLGDLSRPGGQIDQLTRVGLDTESQRGFGPRSGGFERSRLNILDRLNSVTGNLIAQQAPALFSTAVQNRANTISGFGGFVGLQAGRQDALRDSFFSGRFGLEQFREQKKFGAAGLEIERENLKLQKDAQKGGGFFGALGGIAGGLAGSFLGPAGAAAGTKLGSKLFGR